MNSEKPSDFKGKSEKPSDFKGKSEKPSDFKGKLSELKGKTRYNEKSITKNFLSSKDGISFLSEHMKDFYQGEVDKMENIEKDINNILDFYIAWSLKFPLRRADKMSKYEFIKFIENWVEKNDMMEVFSFLYN